MSGAKWPIGNIQHSCMHEGLRGMMDGNLVKVDKPVQNSV